jgi:hypothetical protein
VDTALVGTVCLACSKCYVHEFKLVVVGSMGFVVTQSLATVTVFGLQGTMGTMGTN